VQLFNRIAFGGNPRTFSASPMGRFLVGRTRDVEVPPVSVHFDLSFAETVARLTAPPR
jgi:hypothetical protein